MLEQFIINFINSCIQNNHVTPQDICDLAKNEINKLDKEINEIEKLKSKQSNLKLLVKRLGGEVSPYRTKRHKAPSIVIDFSIPEEELDSNIRELCAKVCDFIDEVDKATVRQTLDAIASIEDNNYVYIAIKWLLDHGILIRDESLVDRILTKGPNWAKKPQYIKQI